MNNMGILNYKHTYCQDDSKCFGFSDANELSTLNKSSGIK